MMTALECREQGIIFMKFYSSVCVCSDDTAEFNQVNTALVSIFKTDAKGEPFFFLPSSFVFIGSAYLVD